MGLEFLLVDNILMSFISLISLGKPFGFYIQVLVNYLSHEKTERSKCPINLFEPENFLIIGLARRISEINC